MDALLRFGGSACSVLLPPRGERALGPLLEQPQPDVEHAGRPLPPAGHEHAAAARGSSSEGAYCPPLVSTKDDHSASLVASAIKLRASDAAGIALGSRVRK
jgi:hypothetical protein